jgi:hypothetical protein
MCRICHGGSRLAETTHRVCHGSGTGLGVPHRTRTHRYRTREMTGTVLHMYIYSFTRRCSVGGVEAQTYGVVHESIYICTGILHLCIYFCCFMCYFYCFLCCFYIVQYFLVLLILYSTFFNTQRWHETAPHPNVHGGEVCWRWRHIVVLSHAQYYKTSTRGAHFMGIVHAAGWLKWRGRVRLRWTAVAADTWQCQRVHNAHKTSTGGARSMGLVHALAWHVAETAGRVG